MTNLKTHPKKMNQVTVNGRIFQYEVKAEISEYGDEYRTEFYEGAKPVRRLRWSWKKFWFEGYDTVEPNHVFTIHASAFEKCLTKGWWKKELEHQVELLGRADELERGELI